MRQKILATGAALVLVSLAAVGTFASQDGVTFLEDPTVEPTATETIEATETAEATATNTPEPTETSDSTASPTETGDATATPAVTETPDDGDEDDDDIHGIPADNPNHVDDDGDGICEKGEAAVKTTPSGNQVRVPCHAADKSDHEEKNKHEDSDDADEAEGDDADEEEDDEADDADAD